MQPYGLGQTQGVVMPTVIPASSGTVLQVGQYGLTQGNLLVYGGTAAGLLGLLFLPDGPLKVIAGAVGIGGAVIIFTGLRSLSGL